MWEDGFCRGRVGDCLEEIDGEDPVRKAFSKMSIQLYNYGEGWVLGRCYYFGLNSHSPSGENLHNMVRGQKLGDEKHMLFMRFD